jgi:enterobactin synthetase component D
MAHPPADVGRGTSGEPLWPAGITGSITHTGDFAWAAAVRTTTVEAIGIDSEMVAPRQRVKRLAAHVLLPEEAGAGGAALDDELRFTAIFSAKEAIYKCLFPVTRRRFYFSDVAIECLDMARGMFSAKLKTKLNERFEEGCRIEGRIAAAAGCVHTGVWVPAGGGCRTTRVK